MTTFEDLTPDNPSRVTLSEASQAVMDVLEECYADLAAIQRRLDGDALDPELEVDEDELPNPREQAQHVAARLEACAGALRNPTGSEH